MRPSVLWTAALGLVGASACGDEGPMPGGPDARAIPDVAYCDAVRGWTDENEAIEARVLERIEFHRSRGASCGERGTFGPAAELQEHGALRCAARVHALDMATRAFVDHENPDGELVADRLLRAGHQPAVASETIAAGEIAPERVVDEAWMQSPGSCATLMDDTVTWIGVGYVVPTDAPTDEQYGAYWTVVLAR